MTARFEPDRVRAILFDLDGTLADTDDALVGRLASRLRWLGRLTGKDPARLARRLILAGETPANALYHFADALGLDNGLAPLFDLIHWLRGEGRPVPVAPVPGALEALGLLSSRYRLAVVTARDRRSALAFLEQTGLRARLACIATARTCSRTKPHPAPLLWASEQMGLPPRLCLMVGDTTVDIRAGRAAGTQTAGVLCGFGERPELERAGADLILPSTADLPAVLPL